MTTTRQLSFSGGEIAPALWARVDLVKYATGLRTCKNFMVMRHGGVTNRPGTYFIGEVKDSTKAVRLIPFVFNASQTYILEFGDQYMRVHRNGAQVTETAQNITGATQANPCVVTISGHGYSNGDEVYISGVEGMTELNNRNFKVANVTANDFELQDMTGTDLDSTGYGAYTSGGTSAKIYEITTPYLEADLFELNYIQSADIVTIAHSDYQSRELARTGHTSWSLSTFTFGPAIARPVNLSSSAGGAGSKSFKYAVTATAEETFEESLVGFDAGQSITAATQANPVQITVTGHGYSTGDRVFITDVGGMTELNNRFFTITKVDADNFTLDDEDGTGHTAYTSGGVSRRPYTRLDSAADPTSGAPHVISWTAVTGAQQYDVYKDVNGQFGWIGVAGGTTFDDTGYTADTADIPPEDRQPFDEAGDYPSTVTYYQQRLMFANTTNNPEGVWASKSSLFKNFMVSTPLQDDDAVTFSLVGRQVNEVKHLLDLGTLIAFTSGGEWAIEGDPSGILAPGEINPRQYSSVGSADIPPLVVEGSALYVQARGSVIRDLAYDYQTDGYRGNELTIFAAHLFDGYTLQDWAYQQVPHSVVWAVRDDGTLLGLTYVREHQVFGWHRHEFEGGEVESVATVPGSGEDVLYLVVKRTINGRTTRYVEYMTTRQVTDIVDAVFVDSALSYDGRNTNTGHTMTLSGGTTWDYDEDLTLTSSASYFSSGDVGNAIWLYDTTGDVVRCTITAYTSDTIVTVNPHKTVPASLQGVATATWSKAVDQLSGLWHLEGEELSVLVDGFVSANPNNDAYTTRTVADGSITLDDSHVVIHAGLPYVSDIQTLNIDRADRVMADKKKQVSRLTMQVEASRGIWAGPDGDNLRELKMRNAEHYDDPIDLATEAVELNIKPEWNSTGSVLIRQIDPLPLSILSVVPAGFISA